MSFVRYSFWNKKDSHLFNEMQNPKQQQKGNIAFRRRAPFTGTKDHVKRHPQKNKPKSLLFARLT